MCLQNAINLQVDTVHACVKVDDTIPGIYEGLNAGMWTGVWRFPAMKSASPWKTGKRLAMTTKPSSVERAYDRMTASSAHYVVDTIADLMACIDAIERRIANGEKP